MVEKKEWGKKTKTNLPPRKKNKNKKDGLSRLCIQEITVLRREAALHLHRIKKKVTNAQNSIYIMTHIQLT